MIRRKPSIILTIASAILFQATADDNSRQSEKATRVNKGRAKGFRLSHEHMESEETQREKEHNDVKVGLVDLKTNTVILS